ncbi:uncharacterized protein LOC135684852 [Rhopilema esculentum]|uniref:uncharacterized protein LOC135684852 n=1 Tax=Rhopilema esculentum TaxID=499914 RepID=UPI0031D1576D
MITNNCAKTFFFAILLTGFTAATTIYRSQEVIIDDADHSLSNIEDTHFPEDRRPASGCFCKNNACSCCQHIFIPFILHTTVCVNVSYSLADLGLKLLIIIDGKIILSQEVSVKNPPPICVEVPVLRRLASFCIDFYNITWHGHVGGCLKLEIKLLYIIEQTYYIGCFHFNNLDAESKAGVSAILRDLHRLQQNRENLATQI